MTWPGETGPPSEAETQVRPPPPAVESTRRGAIREEAKRLRRSGPGVGQVTAGTDLIVLGLLEVAGAIDRLTKAIEERETR